MEKQRLAKRLKELSDNQVVLLSRTYGEELRFEDVIQTIQRDTRTSMRFIAGKEAYLSIENGVVKALLWIYVSEREEEEIAFQIQAALEYGRWQYRILDVKGKAVTEFEKMQVKVKKEVEIVNTFKKDIDMKVWLDRDTCLACGACYSITPDVFDSDGEGYSYVALEGGKENFVEVPDEFKEDTYDAYAGCPTESIKLLLNGERAEVREKLVFALIDLEKENGNPELQRMMDELDELGK